MKNTSNTFTFKVPLVFILLAVFSCQSEKGSKDPNSEEIPSITFSASGKYEGTTPCADCAGIFTTLRLMPDFTYRKSAVYFDKSEETFQSEGTFTFDPQSKIITLDAVPKGPFKYLLEDNQIIQLDMNGEIISGELAKKYYFAKVD